MRFITDNIKNIFGWRTPRKLLVIAADDYGNVRVHSRKARSLMDAEGVPARSRFDRVDAMETREDLQSLFDVLSSVKDANGNNAVLTPYALPCNIDFETIETLGYEKYVYELLPETFTKLSGEDPSYEGTWDLWQEGMRHGLMMPEFHGREHFNIRVFEEKLKSKAKDLMVSLKNRSLAGISDKGIVKYTAAFAFEDQAEVGAFPEIIRTGVEAFKNVFGRQSQVFTPPAHQFPIDLESKLGEFGITTIDKPFYSREHLGSGEYRRRIRFTGYDAKAGLGNMVRNVVFEPTSSNIDWVARALSEVEAAFRWKRPAIVSTHRVNYCGHIDQGNRRRGLDALGQFLKGTIMRWPDVEFISAGALNNLLLKQAKNGDVSQSI